MLLSRSVISILSDVLMVLSADMVSSQDYPNKPIRIWTTPAGGGSDFSARVIAQGITGPLGQPVIVENRPAIISYETVGKALPDGYNLVVAGTALLFSPLLTKTSYDPVKDFSPITITATAPQVLVVHPSLPVKSVRELLALAKARPGELNYSSGPSGSSPHLAGEFFKSLAGVNILRVPYKGGGAALNGPMGGETHMMLTNLTGLTQHVKAGRLRMLAVTSAEPSMLVPGLPTVAASGLPGYEMVTMDFVSAPGGTPASIINRLNQEIVRVLSSTELKEKYFVQGQELAPGPPERLAAKIKADMAAMAKVIRDAGIKLE